MKHKNAMRTKKSEASAMALRGHLLFFGAMCFGVSVFADSFETNLTLPAVLEYGAEHNQELQAAYNQWKATEAEIDVQVGLPDPMVSYGYYFESIETRTGPQNQRFSVSQTFPGFGKLSARKAVASERAATAEQRYERARLVLNLRIAEAYAELYYLSRSIDITTQRIQLVQDMEGIARTRYKSGSTMAPVLQAQLELGRLEDRLESLNDLRGPLIATLNTALNRPAESNLPDPKEIPYRSVAPSAEALRDQLEGTSPELAELQAGITEAESRIDLARRELWPDFTLGVQYIDTGNATVPVSDSGKDPVIGTIGINVPIWFGKNRARVQRASYQKAAAERTLENHKRTLDADIRKALFELRDADRKIALYQDTLVPKAIQSLEVNRQAYEAGSLEFINLLDAERMLLEFQLAQERARADHLIARARLSKLTGVDFLSGETNETY